MTLSFAFTIGLVDDPPCTAFPTSVATLDFVLPNPVCATVLGAYLIGTAPACGHSA